MIVETGLALCAVNLPVVYGQFRRSGISKLIERIRSFVSLRSNANKEREPRTFWTTKKNDTSGPDMSGMKMNGAKRLGKRAPRDESVDTLEKGLIRVPKTTDQTGAPVKTIT